jgi:hypothetical protein
MNDQHEYNLKLDILFDAIKNGGKTSLDYKVFCKKQWGDSQETFHLGEQMVKTLEHYNVAVKTPNNPGYLMLTEPGRLFTSFVKKAEEDKKKLEEENELQTLKKRFLELQHEKITFEKNDRQNKAEIERLEKANLQLQNEAMQYDQTRRTQQERIAALNQINLTWDGKIKKWHWIHIAISAGVAIIAALVGANSDVIFSWI